MGKRASGTTAKVAVAGPVLAALLLTASACGGDEEAAPQPLSGSTSPSPTPSETTSESPTPSPTPTVKPLSRFEDEPAVQAARKWARLYAKTVNRGERNYATVAPMLTPFGRKQMPAIAGEDFGLYYPGPLPFTPTGVQRAGGETEVVGCFWLDGFALNHKGGVPERARDIRAAKLEVDKRDGRWKFVTLTAHNHSCENVPVKGIGW